MPRFYQPDLGSEPDSPFARDGNNKLVRRGYWLDVNDRSLVLAMTHGIGGHLTNHEKRAHLTDLKREQLIDQVCIQEILPPEKTQQIPPGHGGAPKKNEFRHESSYAISGRDAVSAVLTPPFMTPDDGRVC